MPDALSNISLLTTPQNEQADPRQVKNSAGGFVFTVDEMQRLRRFLVLGTEGGTYYIGERELTKQNASSSSTWLHAGAWTSSTRSSRSPTVAVRRKTTRLCSRWRPSRLSVTRRRRTAAYQALTKVARIGTHLFQFLRYVPSSTGWRAGSAARCQRLVPHGRRRSRPPSRSRSTASVRAGRTAMCSARRTPTQRPEPLAGARRALRVDGRQGGQQRAPAEDRSRRTWRRWPNTPAETAHLVREFGLTWEMLQTEHLNEKVVWEALLESDKVGITALIRQLPRLTNLGLLDDLHLAEQGDQPADRHRAAPEGARPPDQPPGGAADLRGWSRSERSSHTWTPVSKVVDALDAAFYAAFDAIVPSGTRHLMALDVSGSMGNPVNGLPLTCREASGAMAMVTL
jgi:60 kDa SS-A/Ro ribonucleoprotein